MRTVAIILCVFAAGWWVVGMWTTHALPLLYCIPFVASAVIIGNAWRQDRNVAASSGNRRHIGRVVGAASACECVAILAAFVFLPQMQETGFSVSVQAIIVGLHFILLARWLPARFYYVTAALLVGLGTTGFAIGSFDLHVRFVCLGAACTLWLSYALPMVWAGNRRCRAIPSGAMCS